MATPKNENPKSNGKHSLKTRLLSTTEVFEEALRTPSLRGAKYILRLYVTGSSTRSLRAISNLKKFCEEHLPDYDLEVIDIYKNPNAAREEQIIEDEQVRLDVRSHQCGLLWRSAQREPRELGVGLDVAHVVALQGGLVGHGLGEVTLAGAGRSRHILPMNSLKVGSGFTIRFTLE